LSIESAVKRILDSYCAIMLSLDAEKSPKAVGLSKFIGNSLFLLFTALLIDILTAIGILSLTFQKDAVNLSPIKHSVTSAKNTLTDMRKGSSKVTKVLNALGEMPTTGEAAKYHDVNVTDNNILRQRFNDIRNTYLDKLSSNLDDRFPSDMLDKLECFDVLFNPGRYPSDLNLLDYGVQQFGVLVVFYQELVSKERMEASFLQFKHLAKSYQVLSFEVLIRDFNEEFPDFLLLGKIALVLPVSSAPCERGFSIQNAIKNKSRNRITPERLNRLMFIKLNGGSVEYFDFARAAKIFTDMQVSQTVTQGHSVTI
ncbi:uncharacterized protein C17orf113-like, partial [Liolophura sinensis]|uniref:uncharacterized protein C17orf113-like n=1 Tax=Liolophura sinensis TaxID=3198878 RepID=UPI003159950F